MVEQRDLEIIFNNPIDWERFRNKTVLVTGRPGVWGCILWRQSAKRTLTGI